jgi:O-succinylbenzoate synthase
MKGMNERTFYVWEYLLRSEVALNSASSRRVFPGALIHDGRGYACIHPWPEFGDAELGVHLQSLLSDCPTALAQRALACLEVDGAARAAGVSLFADVEIPVSHYSWSFGHATGPQLRRLVDEGWLAIKCKGYSNWGETLRFLEATQKWMLQHAPGCELRFRIDFNHCLTPDAFHKFIEFMPLKLYRALDFVEDPYPYERDQWVASQQRWGIKLALDKGWQRGTEGFAAVVVKPARRDWRSVAALHGECPLVLTSAMDHPLGQMFAAYEAACAVRDLGPERVGLTGLCTQHLFAEDDFSVRIPCHGGVLSPDFVGGGLGFGDLLEGLPWLRLS